MYNSYLVLQILPLVTSMQHWAKRHWRRATWSSIAIYLPEMEHNNSGALGTLHCWRFVLLTLCNVVVVVTSSACNTGGGNSSYMQRLVKGDFRRVFHAAVGKRLVFFHVKVGTDILFFCLP